MKQNKKIKLGHFKKRASQKSITKNYHLVYCDMKIHQIKNKSKQTVDNIIICEYGRDS